MRDEHIQEILGRWQNFLGHFKLFNNPAVLISYLRQKLEQDESTREIAGKIQSGKLTFANDEDFLRVNETVVKYIGHSKIFPEEMALMEAILHLVGTSDMGHLVDCSYTLPGTPFFFLEEGICASATCINPSQGYVEMIRDLALQTRPSLQVRQGPLCSIPLEAGSANTLLCLETLEWFRDWHRAIPEFARVLSLHGKFMITLKPHGFRGIIPPHDLSWFLKDSGLETEAYQMGPNRCVFIGTKP